MSQYSHILAGLDLSEDSQQILQKVAVIAKAFNAEVSIAHVVEPLAFAYGGDVPLDLTQAQNSMEDQARSRLTKMAADMSLTTVNQFVTVGQTSSELHRLANEAGADLIIVGSHGRHGLALVFGSTAGGVIKGAETDVLAVRI